MVFSLTYFFCCICAAQAREPQKQGKTSSAITFEAVSFIKSNEIEIGFCHRIGRKWTVSFSSAVSIGNRVKNEEMTEHENSFMEEVVESVGPVRQEHGFKNEAAAIFWTKEIFEGPFISMGIGHDNRMEPDIIISFGYMFTIYKHIKGQIGYRTEMISSLRHDDDSGCHITAGFGFSF